MNAQVRRTFKAAMNFRMMRPVDEVNSEFENSSLHRTNTYGSSLVRTDGEGASSGNLERQSGNNSNNKGVAQAFEPARVQFSPVTSDSGEAPGGTP